MKKVMLSSVFLLAGVASQVVMAQGDASKKEEVKYVCEKKDKDGKEIRIEAKTKDECKQKGGKWEKDHVDDHQHKEGDKH